MKIDNRVFAYAGASLDMHGTQKMRFTNDIDAMQMNLTKRENTCINVIKLPHPMTKLDACNWFLANQQEVVAEATVREKISYITNRTNIINGVPSGKKRGRPRLSAEIKQIRILEKEKRKNERANAYGMRSF